MNILVGIPSFRRPARLARLMASLAQQQGLYGHDVQVFVADNDPLRHEAASLCETLGTSFPWPLRAGVVDEPGIAAARNRLLDEARTGGADWLAMIDDDERATPHWLSAMVAAAASQGAAITGGPVEYCFETPPHRALLRSGAFCARSKRSGPVDALNATGNVIFNCAALADAGWPGFDQGFGLSGGEDKEFFTRLRRHGLRFGWATDALVYEDVPAERMRVRAVLRRAFGIGGSDYRIAARHGPQGAAALHLVRSSAVLAAALLLSPLLVLPACRLWMLRRIARASGRIAAAFGIRRAQYGASVSP